MPIRRELRPLYPYNWRELSRKLRFERAGGKCQRCGRPHGQTIRVLRDGRWFDAGARSWRDGRARPARWPDLEEAIGMRETRVVLAAAHLDHDPRHNRWCNLKCLCQRCHLMHDRAYHLAQRRITYRLRYALGDLFLGVYKREFEPLNAG
jgi:5-methylcytosine-specific restriction endonuclease McrA